MKMCSFALVKFIHFCTIKHYPMRIFCSLILCVILLCLSVQVWAADRDFWIQRYLSVSYPLKHVKVNSPFGTRRDPFTGAKASHNGLDLKAYYEEVYAMFDGTVKKVGADPLLATM